MSNWSGKAGRTRGVMSDPASAYEVASARALAWWKRLGGSGKKRPAPFHPTRLAMTTGSYLGENARILGLHEELSEAIASDPLADLNPRAYLHFTFLALSVQAYAGKSALPGHARLREAYERICQGHTFTVTRLRLVALPNALLLAGVADEATQERRGEFARAVLASNWRDRLEARYPDGVIPPVFWHSTLLRYHAEGVSPAVREFFARHRGEEFGRIRLPIRLMATSYNWSRLVYLDESGKA